LLYFQSNMDCNPAICASPGSWEDTWKPPHPSMVEMESPCPHQNAKWWTTLEKIWQSPRKLKIFLPYDPGSTCFCIYPPKLKTYVHTKIYTNSSHFIHNFHNLEKTIFSFNRWMDKWIVINLESGILFSNKNKWLLKPWEHIQKI
jgi:hypothetical protein